MTDDLSADPASEPTPPGQDELRALSAPRQHLTGTLAVRLARTVRAGGLRCVRLNAYAQRGVPTRRRA